MNEKHQPDSEPAGSWSRRAKIGVSVLLLGHLLAVVLPPLAFQTRNLDGPSPWVGQIVRPVAGYGQFLHLDRGYAFFAPNPGPSHLIEAALTQEDGSVVEQTFPNLDDQWPRLLYHRHFMLAEYLNEIYFPPGPPEELVREDRRLAQQWQQRRARYEYFRQSLVDHLRAENDGREVAIRRIEHALPTLPDYRREPIALTDPRLYRILADDPILTDDVGPDGEREEIPVPERKPGSSESAE